MSYTKRRYFIGFTEGQPISFAPIAYPPTMANNCAKMPELDEVTFAEWYVFNRETTTEYSVFPKQVPNEDYYWKNLSDL